MKYLIINALNSNGYIISIKLCPWVRKFSTKSQNKAFHTPPGKGYCNKKVYKKQSAIGNFLQPIQSISYL
jgi:hypothetical protein